MPSFLLRIDRVHYFLCSDFYADSSIFIDLCRITYALAFSAIESIVKHLREKRSLGYEHEYPLEGEIQTGIWQECTSFLRVVYVCLVSKSGLPVHHSIRYARDKMKWRVVCTPTGLTFPGANVHQVRVPDTLCHPPLSAGGDQGRTMEWCSRCFEKPVVTQRL